jgi:hypothetical protein
MIRYVTLHIIKTIEDAPDGHFEVDLMLADSNNPYPDTEKIKGIIRPGYQIKGDSTERILKLILNKIARYVYKVYPFVMSIKLRATFAGEWIEMSLEETEVTDQQEG